MSREAEHTSGKLIGRIEKLHRYPVKSMAGEQLEEAFVGYSGLYGDRIYAFKSPEAPSFFPYFTGRDRQQMLLYIPRFRHPEYALGPHSWADAEAYSIGISPVFASEQELAVDVKTPQGEVFAIDDPVLANRLANLPDGGQADPELNRELNREGSPEPSPKLPPELSPELSLCRSDRALTDGRPVSLISSQTVNQLSKEIGIHIDDRRFRANIVMDLAGLAGFSEDQLVGQALRLGERVVVAIVERDPRCEMITFDPDTGVAEPAILRHVGQAHERLAGVYAAVLVEGVIKPGDGIRLES